MSGHFDLLTGHAALATCSGVRVASAGPGTTASRGMSLRWSAMPLHDALARAAGRCPRWWKLRGWWSGPRSGPRHLGVRRSRGAKGMFGRDLTKTKAVRKVGTIAGIDKPDRSAEFAGPV